MASKLVNMDTLKIFKSMQDVEIDDKIAAANTGKGRKASEIEILDADQKFNALNVEDALIEIKDEMATMTVPQVTQGGTLTGGAQIMVYTTSNANVSLYAGSLKVASAVASNGVAIFTDISYGEYTVQGVLSSITAKGKDTIVVDTLRQYYTSIEFSNAVADGTGCTVGVMVEKGAKITITYSGGSTVTEGKVDSGYNLIDLPDYSLTYTVTVEKNGGKESQTAKFLQGNRERYLTFEFTYLDVYAPVGTQISASYSDYNRSDEVQTGEEFVRFYIPYQGNYTLTGTYTSAGTTKNYTRYVYCYKNQENKTTIVKTVYGFYVDANANVSYLSDCDNKNYTAASMNYSYDLFNLGSWTDNEFFMPRPCMVKYDGTVDYYLDPNDYTKKEDKVTESDVANPDYEGNAMMEWGRYGCKIWVKIIPDSGNEFRAKVYIADDQVDDQYHCYNFINEDGDEVDHFYTPIYNGSLIEGRLRSISGQKPIAEQSIQNQYKTARQNNVGDANIWTMETNVDHQLVTLLIMLISKSVDTQNIFGNGRVYADNIIDTGSLDKKGLFYGKNDKTTGVKIFGMEHWWGNIYRNTLGWFERNSETRYCKMTAEGGYDLDFENFKTSNDWTIPEPYQQWQVTQGTPYISGWLVQLRYDNQYWFYPNSVKNGTADGSNSTFYRDYINTGSNCIRSYARYYRDDLSAGAFTHAAQGINSVSSVYGASISMRPKK